MSAFADKLARLVGAYYDGDADPETLPNNYRRAMGAVRELLEAMREPDREMADAGRTYAWDYDDGNARLCWEAMIEEALK